MVFLTSLVNVLVLKCQKGLFAFLTFLCRKCKDLLVTQGMFYAIALGNNSPFPFPRHQLMPLRYFIICAPGPGM